MLGVVVRLPHHGQTPSFASAQMSARDVTKRLEGARREPIVLRLLRKVAEEAEGTEPTLDEDSPREERASYAAFMEGGPPVYVALSLYKKEGVGELAFYEDARQQDEHRKHRDTYDGLRMSMASELGGHVLLTLDAIAREREPSMRVGESRLAEEWRKGESARAEAVSSSRSPESEPYAPDNPVSILERIRRAQQRPRR